MILALSSSGMVAAYSLIYGFWPDITLLLIPFLVTFASYHINRIAEISEDIISHPERTAFIIKNESLNLLALLFYFLAAALSLLRNVGAFILVLIPPLIVIVYSFNFNLNFGEKAVKMKRAKDVLYVKNLIVALTWTTYAFFTATYFNVPLINEKVLVMALFIFLRFYVNTVVFDMRDVFADRSKGIRTLPVVHGEVWTRNFLFLINILAGAFIILASYFEFIPKTGYFLSLITIYGIWFTWESVRRNWKNMSFFTDVLVDGEFVIWPILILIGMFLFGM